MKKEEKTHWEKKQWEKPTVKSLSVKGTTLGGPADHDYEQTEPPYKKGYKSPPS